MSGRFNGVPLAVVSLVLAAPALAAPPEAAAPIAEEQLGGTLLTLVPRIPYERAELRVSGPKGYALSKVVTEGAITADLLAEAESRVADRQEDPRAAAKAALVALPDGRYNYEAVFLDAEGQQQVFTGLLFVEGGVLLSREAKRQQLTEVRERLQSEIEGLTSVTATAAEDNYIQIADYANDGTTFLDLDSDSPTSAHWFLYNQNGTLHISENTTAYDPTGTIRVTFERGGQVGIGTTAPARDLHIFTGDTPALRLEQTGGGFTTQTWDIAGNEANFFIRDGSSLPFRIRPGAPTSSIDISADGDVGVGTDTPATSLNLVRSDGTAKIQVEELSGTTAVRELFKLVNNGGPFFVFADTSLGESWSFAMGAVGDFILSHQQTAGVEARLQPDGDLIIAGSLTQASSRTIKKEIELVEPAAVLAQVLELPIAEWSYRGDEQRARHVGPMAEDFHTAFGLGPNDQGIAPSDTGGVALAAIQGLHATIAEDARVKDERLRALEERNAELERTVARLATAIETISIGTARE